MEATRTHSLRLLWPYGLPWRDRARTTALSVGPSGLLPVFANKTIDREAIFWEHRVNRAVPAGSRTLVATHAGR